VHDDLVDLDEIDSLEQLSSLGRDIVPDKNPLHEIMALAENAYQLIVLALVGCCDNGVDEGVRKHPQAGHQGDLDPPPWPIYQQLTRLGRHGVVESREVVEQHITRSTHDQLPIWPARELRETSLDKRIDLGGGEVALLVQQTALIFQEPPAGLNDTQLDAICG
jgi:hypothetical protein